MICVYSIVNKQENKVYIGSTINYEYRIKHHNSLFRRGKHQKDLQQAYNKNLLTIQPLFECDRDNLRNYEQGVLNYLFSVNIDLYNKNINYMSTGMTYRKHSPETKRKISSKFKGKNNHAYGKQYFKGHKHTKETLMKMSKPKKDKYANTVKNLLQACGIGKYGRYRNAFT